MIFTGFEQCIIFFHTGGSDDSNATKENVPLDANDKVHICAVHISDYIKLIQSMRMSVCDTRYSLGGTVVQVQFRQQEVKPDEGVS